VVTAVRRELMTPGEGIGGGRGPDRGAYRAADHLVNSADFHPVRSLPGQPADDAVQFGPGHAK